MAWLVLFGCAVASAISPVQPDLPEELRSSFGFLAIHGGSLERGTAEVAAEAADRAGASVYAVRQPENLRWHIPSALVDPSLSPALSSFLEHIDLVVSVHGYGRRGFSNVVLIGGRNRQLAALAGPLSFIRAKFATQRSFSAAGIDEILGEKSDTDRGTGAAFVGDFVSDVPHEDFRVVEGCLAGEE